MADWVENGAESAVAEKIIPGVYQHWKGGLYSVITTAKHTETLEEMVVYRSLKDGKVWIRPASMWNDVVNNNGELVRRFTLKE